MKSPIEKGIFYKIKSKIKEFIYPEKTKKEEAILENRKFYRCRFFFSSIY